MIRLNDDKCDVEKMGNGKYDDGVTVQALLASLIDGENVHKSCEMAGISEDTYYRWLKEHSEFSDEVKKAKEVANDNRIAKLEASLYKRAMGFDYKERKSELAANPMGGAPIIVKQTVTEKHIAPDTAALIFALTNLAPEKWKNKQNTEHSGEVNTGLTFIVAGEEDKERVKKLGEWLPDGFKGEDIQEEP